MLHRSKAKAHTFGDLSCAPIQYSSLSRKTPLVAKPSEPKRKTRKCKDCSRIMERFSAGNISPRCAPCRNQREQRLDIEARQKRGAPTFPPPKKQRSQPMPSRNAKRRPTGSGSAQRERVVLERANGRCEFRVPMRFYGTLSGPSWIPCGSTERVETVHLVRRWKHAAPIAGDEHAVFSDAAAFAGCEACHDKYDGRAPGRELVRIPEEYRLAAFLAIRYAEVKRILSYRAVVAVDLSELLPAGEWSIDNQFALVDAARKTIAGEAA